MQQYGKKILLSKDSNIKNLETRKEDAYISKRKNVTAAESLKLKRQKVQSQEIRRRKVRHLKASR